MASAEIPTEIRINQIGLFVTQLLFALALLMIEDSTAARDY